MQYPHLENAGIITVKKSNLARWAWLVGLVAFFSLAFFLNLWSQEPAAPEPPKALGASQSPVPEPCGLADVECPQEAVGEATTSQGKPQKVLTATVYTYQAVSEQTDGDPCVGAMPGVDFCNQSFEIVANNCLPLGTWVWIRETPFMVADRMNARYGCDVFDILIMPYDKPFKWTNEPVTVVSS